MMKRNSTLSSVRHFDSQFFASWNAEHSPEKFISGTLCAERALFMRRKAAEFGGAHWIRNDKSSIDPVFCFHGSWPHEGEAWSGVELDARKPYRSIPRHYLNNESAKPMMWSAVCSASRGTAQLPATALPSTHLYCLCWREETEERENISCLLVVVMVAIDKNILRKESRRQSTHVFEYFSLKFPSHTSKRIFFLPSSMIIDVAATTQYAKSPPAQKHHKNHTILLKLASRSVNIMNSLSFTRCSVMMTTNKKSRF